VRHALAGGSARRGGPSSRNPRGAEVGGARCLRPPSCAGYGVGGRTNCVGGPSGGARCRTSVASTRGSRGAHTSRCCCNATGAPGNRARCRPVRCRSSREGCFPTAARRGETRSLPPCAQPRRHLSFRCISSFCGVIRHGRAQTVTTDRPGQERPGWPRWPLPGPAPPGPEWGAARLTACQPPGAADRVRTGTAKVCRLTGDPARTRSPLCGPPHQVVRPRSVRPTRGLRC